MVNVLLNIGLITLYCGLVVWVMLLIRRRNDESSPTLAVRSFLYVYAAAIILLLKFWQLEDSLLLVGQILVTFLLTIYALLLVGQVLVPTPGRPQQAVFSAPNPVPAKERHISKRWKLALVAFIVVLAAAGWLIKLFNTSPVGTVGKPVYQASSVPTTEQVTFTGKKFSFTYPNHFTASTTSAPKPPILESYVLLKRSTLSWQLAIQIESLPSGNFSDSGAYHFRQVHPERFSEVRAVANGMPVRVMTDKEATGSFAKNAFLVHNNILASVSLVGGSTADRDAMQADFDNVLSTWKWLP